MKKKISIFTSGTFHFFDLSSELSKSNNLEKIYSFRDFLRILKWRNRTSLLKINNLESLFQNEKRKIKNFKKKILNDNSDIIISHPGICEEIFISSNKEKLLDLSHFNWDQETINKLKNKKLKYFDINKPLDPNKFIMEKEELRKRLPDDIFQNINFSNSEQTIKECEIADKILVPTKNLKDCLISSGYPSDKIIHRTLGFDEEIFFPNIENKEKYILYAGTVSHRKGWVSLKKFINLWNNSEFKLIIVGGIQKEIKKDFFDTISKSRNTKYLGQPFFRKSFAKYLRDAKLYLFPSYFEVLVLTILQALASGPPAITSKATCGSDLILNNYNGYVFDNFDMEMWVDKVYEIVSDNNKNLQMCANAFTSVKNFTWKRYIKQLS